MKEQLLTALLCLAFCQIGLAQRKEIRDTDPSSNPDDVGCMAMLHTMASLPELSMSRNSSTCCTRETSATTVGSRKCNQCKWKRMSWSGTSC